MAMAYAMGNIDTMIIVHSMASAACFYFKHLTMILVDFCAVRVLSCTHVPGHHSHRARRQVRRRAGLCVMAEYRRIWHGVLASVLPVKENKKWRKGEGRERRKRRDWFELNEEYGKGFFHDEQALRSMLKARVNKQREQ